MRVAPVLLLAFVTGLALAAPTANRQWTEVEQTNPFFKQYQNLGLYSLTYVEETESYLLFGGADENAFRNELWSLDMSGKWTLLKPSGDLPPARTSHSAVWMNNILFVVGGMVEGDTDGSNIMWMYNMHENKWTRAANSDMSPPEVIGLMMTPVPGHDDMLAVVNANEANRAYIFDTVKLQWTQSMALGLHSEDAHFESMAALQVVGGHIRALVFNEGKKASMRSITSELKWIKVGEDLDLDLNNHINIEDDAETRVAMLQADGMLVIPGIKSSIIMSLDDYSTSTVTHEKESDAPKSEVWNFHFAYMPNGLLVIGGNDWYEPEVHMAEYSVAEMAVTAAFRPHTKSLDTKNESVGILAFVAALVAGVGVVAVGAALMYRKAMSVVDSSVSDYLSKTGAESQIPLASQRQVAVPRSEGPVGSYIPPAF